MGETRMPIFFAGKGWGGKLTMPSFVGFPTAPKGKACIRTLIASEHTRDQIDQALGILETTVPQTY